MTDHAGQSLPQGETQRAVAVLDRLKRDVSGWRDVAKQIAALPAEAQALKSVLSDGFFVANATAYQAANVAAAKAQTRHQRTSRRAGLLGFFAALLAGFMLYLGMSATSGPEGAVLAVLQLALIGAGVVAANVIAITKPYKTWREERGTAEACRIEHFDRVMAAEPLPVAAGQIALKPLALEYLRVYLIEDQRGWYTKRAGQFAQQTSRRQIWQIVAIVLLVIAAVPGAATLIQLNHLAHYMPPRLIAAAVTVTQTVDGKLLAMLGLFGGALQTLVACLAAVSLADRNKTTYQEMAKALTALDGEPLKAARLSAATGQVRSLDVFWQKLRFQLIAEHLQWGAALSMAQLLTLDRLADYPTKSTS